MPCHCHCLVTVFNVLPVRAAMHTLSHKCSICCIANVCLAHCGKHAVQLFNDLRNCICTTSAPSRSSSSILEAATESVRAGTNMPSSTQTRAAFRTKDATWVLGHTGSPAWVSTCMASGTSVGTGMHCDCARPINSCSSLSSMAIRPGAISSLMMYAAAAMSKWSHIHSA